MVWRHRRRPRRRPLALAALACCALVAAIAAGLLSNGVTGRAEGSEPSVKLDPDTYQTDAGIPASSVTMIGSSPQEAPAETWGIGQSGSQSNPTSVIVRYTEAGGWTRAPAIEDEQGQPLSGFQPANSPLAGQIAPDGAGAIVGFVKSSATTSKVLLTRDPGQPFRETPPPQAPTLVSGEEFFPNPGTPMLAALEEGSHAGALVVPVGGEGAEPAVLHWEGAVARWTRESIEVPATSSKAGFQVIAIAGSSPDNAWLLARLSAGSEAVALFRRDPGSGGAPAVWKPVAPEPGQEAGAPLTVEVHNGEREPVTVEEGTRAQLLTVTEKGLWVDGERRDVTSTLTLFFEPSGPGADSGKIKASWCNAPQEKACTQPLPEALPAGDSRSYAWAKTGSEFGERVITGFADGVLLRLKGSEFQRLPTLGGPAEAPVGASKGAAFSSATEGWLGNVDLPVHVTAAPKPSSLVNWPVPFRKPLLALAAQPEQPVGPLGSEALAVGEAGEVARYRFNTSKNEPEGWEPESLLNASGRRAKPQLHAVAWPTKERAYAVGVDDREEGEEAAMWLWRGETKLWEPDPAMPPNLRANLLSIAFAPGDPQLGYAAGQGLVGGTGVLLRYGKSWTQEQDLPSEVAGASFTSVAFAGTEALVAYRVAHRQNEQALTYTGGVIANSGSGWHVDTALEAALPTSYVPWAVAGLPDGGAAVSAEAPGANQEPVVLMRESTSAAWQPAPPYPGAFVAGPASLALFREGGALRVVAAGAIPNTVQADSQPQAPAGAPPTIEGLFPLSLGPDLFSETAQGWSDEAHERHIPLPPIGDYSRWDIPEEPDDTAAVLIDESGTSGWEVGGTQAGLASTADIARYSAGSSPPTENPMPTDRGSAPIQAHGVTFAVGGGSQCAAPCSDLEHAGIGPDEWLSSALKLAGSIEGVGKKAGGGAFLYTGPRVTNGESPHPEIAIPYEREEARYAALLGASPQLRVYTVASPSDRPSGDACVFENALETAFPNQFPFEPKGAPCAPGDAAYYDVVSEGVRVIFLDTAGIEKEQLKWLNEQLEDAKNEKIPAIVVGNADLPEEVRKHEPVAEQVAGVMVEKTASAYFFDAPEQNIATTLGSVPAFGTGTLGYVQAINSEKQDFIGASGFLLAHVEAGPHGELLNGAKVTVQLIPDIGELSLEAKEGTLLRRSQAALFSALARRPRAGGVGSGESAVNESGSYIPIPAECSLSSQCGEGLTPEYEFTSSNEATGKFVPPNTQISGPNPVPLLDTEGNVPLEPDPKSGLFCALNGGETVVTIKAGGMSASLRVHVEAGSVRRPCGTTPLKNPPSHARPVSVPVQPESTPGSTPSAAPILPVPPLPAPLPAAPPARLPAPTPPPPFLSQPITAAPVAPILPPPPPAPAEPTPPSGTSAVTSPVEAAQREEEQEEAPESVSAQAVAYRPAEHEPPAGYLIGLIVLAAFAGASLRKRPGRGRRDAPIAPATLSLTRSQRRISDHRRRPW